MMAILRAYLATSAFLVAVIALPFLVFQMG